MAAIFTVTSTADTNDALPGNGVCADTGGVCTFRAALQEANALAGTDTINFNIGAGGAQSISITVSLPSISQAVVINGASQPGSVGGTPLIEINGNNIASDGLAILANGSTVRGLIINRFGGNGISIQNAGSSGNLIAGNFIGTNAAGTAASTNGLNGIFISGAPNNTIGGTTTADRNVISGNTQNGIAIQNSAATGTLIVGNLIGRNAANTAAIPNAQNGIRIDAPSTTIGGAAAGQGNTISGNTQAGVSIINAGSTNNRISRNSIFTNGGLGIDLGADGVTPNDPGDGDLGPNNLQNFPVITNAVQGSTIISFTLNSTASTTFTVEFFFSTTADPSGNGEGQTFLGTMNVTTNAAGNFSGTFTSATTVTAGQIITATATNPTGNTSEFSNTRVVTTATAAKFVEASAWRTADSVFLKWRTAMEIDNLGFNVYREERGQRRLLTQQLVAGSALFAGKGSVLTAGNNYAWVDKHGAPESVYWIEDVDLNGKHSLHGPIVPQPAREKFPVDSSPLLGELFAGQSRSGQREWPTDTWAFAQVSTLTAQPSATFNPSLPGIKLSVDHDDWYRVTQPQLVAAGLDPNSDARLLQLYVDGAEVPIELSSNSAQLNAADSLEFYGQALSTPTTGIHTYYLISSSARGKRILSVAEKRVRLLEPLGENNNASFSNTIEREDKLIYFSSLLNGEAENIFGPVINNTTVTQTLVVQSLAKPDSTDALEVALQGVNDQPHQVRVSLNNVDLGVVQFQGKEHQSLKLPVPSGVLKEGENQVGLASTASPTDLSLLDYLRLTYQKQYRATDNRLLFTVAAGRRLTVTGFSTAQLRLFDITDPLAPVEREVTTSKNAGSYVVNISATSTARTMLLMSKDSALTPAAIEAKPSSTLSATTHSADLLIITHKDFHAAADNLAAWRRGQGLEVEVADVDSVYDEFSYGTHAPLALKNFLQWTTTHWQKAPRYVLLIGDSSWDPRNYLGNGAFDFVPTRLLDTANMETASDDWLADFDGDGIPEMAVGRLPVRTLNQATDLVNKLIAYDQSPVDPERGALLVADGGFESISNNLAQLLPMAMPVETINRSSGPDDATIRSQILSSLNAGPDLVSFAGHGSVTVWTGAGLLRSEDAASLNNSGRLPLMVLLTCLNGYSHDPVAISLGKSMVLAPNTGAIATWSSSGMTEPGA
ncbi:MAG TPA: C25 family cysteine peptidase, partial [Pyrinomonadaceae bacterium]|nr:C25 family cysteine peptidase [Pyrinomonadaceae bacterium]